MVKAHINQNMAALTTVSSELLILFVSHLTLMVHHSESWHSSGEKTGLQLWSRSQWMFKTSSNVCLDHSCPYSQTSCVHVVFLITRPHTKQAYVLTITLRHRQTWRGGGWGGHVCVQGNKLCEHCSQQGAQYVVFCSWCLILNTHWNNRAVVLMLAMLRTRLAVFWRRPLMKRAVLRAVQTNGAMIGQTSGVDL